ncbi:MAG TPA: MgtC/SapB family protein, partial [Actinomycetota bacterium]|nr:MgtC/SapB family protein [Actinomycetota bacterium]
VSAYGFQVFLGEQPTQVRFDPTRIAAQIVSGIGFLGAGAILRYGATVRGLTTAASLWVVAAVGLAVAIGSYWVAVTTTGITVAALWGLKHLRGLLVRGLKADHEEITLEVDDDVRVDRIVSLIAEAGGMVRNLRIDEEGEARTLSLFVRFDPGATPEALVTGLSRVAGVRNVDWTR